MTIKFFYLHAVKSLRTDVMCACTYVSIACKIPMQFPINYKTHVGDSNAYFQV